MTQGRIRDILTYLVKRMLHRTDKTLTEDVIIEELLQKGFNMEEIEEALEILSEIGSIEAHVSESPPSSDSLRVLDDYERHRFSLEAQGLLITLSYFKLLSPQQIDELIDRSMSLKAAEITKEELINQVVMMISEEEGIAPTVYLLRFLMGEDR